MTPLERIHKHIINLNINKPLYGLTLSYLNILESKEIETLKGKIPNPTMATNSINLYYNEEFVRNLNDDDLKFILMHEAYHILAGHCDPNFNKRLFSAKIDDNLRDLLHFSMEYENNSFLIEQEKISNHPKELLYLKKYDSKTWAAERIFEDLQKNIDPKLISNNSGCCCKDSKCKCKKIKTLDTHISLEEFLSNGELNEKSGIWKQRIQSIIQEAHKQGKLPEELKRKFENILYPKKDWKTELAEYLQFDRTEYSFMPSDRRFLWQDLCIPDLRDTEKLNLVVAIDTSGSINQEVFDNFISEIRGILTCVQNVNAKIMICDAKVHSIIDIDDEDKIKDIVFKGGGGTDFRPVFKKLDKLENPTQVIVYFTDGYGTFPESAPVQDVLWAIYGDYDLSKIPFGKTIKID